MWSFYRGDYIIPAITEWKGYDGDGILPIEPHETFFRIKQHEIQGNSCRMFKAITPGGQLEDLCCFCKHGIERSVRTNMTCKFAYDKNKETHYGWDEDDLGLLVGTIEIPAVALLPEPEAPPVLSNFSFKVGRILENVKKLIDDKSYFMRNKGNVHVNYYATRTTTIRPHSKEAWDAKLRVLAKRLAQYNRSDIKHRMTTLEI